jgi:hypothetical protein
MLNANCDYILPIQYILNYGGPSHGDVLCLYAKINEDDTPSYELVERYFQCKPRLLHAICDIPRLSQYFYEYIHQEVLPRYIMKIKIHYIDRMDLFMRVFYEVVGDPDGTHDIFYYAELELQYFNSLDCEVIFIPRTSQKRTFGNLQLSNSWITPIQDIIPQDYLKPNPNTISKRSLIYNYGNFLLLSIDSVHLVATSMIGRCAITGIYSFCEIDTTKCLLGLQMQFYIYTTSTRYHLYSSQPLKEPFLINRYFIQYDNNLLLLD